MTSTAQRSKPRYDGNAEWYDQVFAGYGDLSDPLSNASYLVRVMEPGLGRCLDVGCGGGLHHEAIRSTGRSVVGIDLSRDQLRVAQRRRYATLVQASATALPFRDESFPLVACTFLHTDIDHMAPVFAEIRRVLQREGRLVYLGVHPCFWGHFIENPGADDRVVHPGYLETGWLDSPYLRNPEGLRARVGARHVTVSELLNSLVGAGLTLTGLDEPPGRTGHADRIVILATRQTA